MLEDPPALIRKAFPRTWYYPKWRLLAWFPRGVLNEACADQVFTFIEMEERIQDAPFDRYADLSGLTGVRIRLDHLFENARPRSKAKQPVKSALYAELPSVFDIAQIYEHLMEGSMIEVLAFRGREAAAEWLEVPLTALKVPEEVGRAEDFPATNSIKQEAPT